MLELRKDTNGKRRDRWVPTFKRLTPEAVARVRAKLDRLEVETMFTTDWPDVERLIGEVRFSLNRGIIMCHDVRPLAEALARHGVE